MNWTTEFTHDFLREAKRLLKRYKSFRQDLETFRKDLLENPFQGAELYPGIRKVRMAIQSKGKGKSGGARIITFTYYVSEKDGRIVFLLIYDKTDADTVDAATVKQIVQQLGFNLQDMETKGLLPRNPKA